MTWWPPKHFLILLIKCWQTDKKLIFSFAHLQKFKAAVSSVKPQMDDPELVQYGSVCSGSFPHGLICISVGPHSV